MPRKKLIVMPGDDVHTVFRVVNREFVFVGQAEHDLFLRALRRQKLRYGAAIYAWVGMGNHHHVFNQVPVKWHEETAHARFQKAEGVPMPVSTMVCDTQSYFARTFNHFTGRCGDLIDGRTKQIRICGDFHALTLLIYIFLNPVRAGIVSDPADYSFTNYRAYAFGSDGDADLFQLHPAFLRLGHSPAERQVRFRGLIQHAQETWAKKRWPGASGHNGPGKGVPARAYEDFLRHSLDWGARVKFF
jgi:putative transposase